MGISVFELFSIGVGPSSSHTVGPMRAARRFVLNLENEGLLEAVGRVRADIYGSLALTGKGHGTDRAILVGLEGESPEEVDPSIIEEKITRIRITRRLKLLGKMIIPFEEPLHLVYHYQEQLPFHPNGMQFTAYDNNGRELKSQIFYSIGGGFIVDQDNAEKEREGRINCSTPYPFTTASELLAICNEKKMTIAELMMANESIWRSPEEIRSGLLNLWKVMKACVEHGCLQEGILPGGLNVKRRAPHICRELVRQEAEGKKDPGVVLDWVSLWALAVNEENAAGGRVVMAPTNGAAGIIPAVMHYYMKFTENPSEEGIITFLLTAGAIGILYKSGASLSAAEMGCQGEVGSACSMAAGGLAAVQGGSNEQIENAAEIGMEHNLGLTCDPVKGLVQIPCIERNTMGAIKAINAARLALKGDGTHKISLDQVIATMRQVGHDMKVSYKKTAQGGLAVNVVEC